MAYPLERILKLSTHDFPFMALAARRDLFAQRHTVDQRIRARKETDIQTLFRDIDQLRAVILIIAHAAARHRPLKRIQIFAARAIHKIMILFTWITP